MKYFFITALLFGLSLNLSAQGCSDAGFCTMESFQANHQDSSNTSTNNTFKIGESIGLGAKNILAHATYVDYGRKFGNAFKINLRVTSLFQTGNGISSFGISDAFVNGTVKFSDYVNFTAGAKIPLANANKKQNGIALPMDYQSSLGTFDAIFGLGFNLKGYKISIAAQQPITQNNNTFFSHLHPENSILREFQSTNNFHRYADVLISISKPLKLNKQWIFTPNLLPIYHVKEDTYSNLNNEVVNIAGSQGLTFNINLYFDYKINERNNLQINAGAPVIARKSRPEGLTRSGVVNLEYSVLF